MILNIILLIIFCLLLSNYFIVRILFIIAGYLLVPFITLALALGYLIINLGSD